MHASQRLLAHVRPDELAVVRTQLPQQREGLTRGKPVAGCQVLQHALCCSDGVCHMSSSSATPATLLVRRQGAAAGRWVCTPRRRLWARAQWAGGWSWRRWSCCACGGWGGTRCVDGWWQRQCAGVVVDPMPHPGCVYCVWWRLPPQTHLCAWRCGSWRGTAIRPRTDDRDRMCKHLDGDGGRRSWVADRVSNCASPDALNRPCLVWDCLKKPGVILALLLAGIDGAVLVR